MTRSQLITQLAIKFPKFTQLDIQSCVEVIIESVGDSLAYGGRTEIRGFGSFSRHIHPARVGRNPKSGERVDIPNKAAPHFKCSKDVLDALNQVAAELNRLAA